MTSAYIETLGNLTSCLTSFTKKNKNKGPRYDPCGTPDVTLIVLDKLPSNLTFCVLSVECNSIQLSKLELNPSLANLKSNKLTSTLHFNHLYPLHSG